MGDEVQKVMDALTPLAEKVGTTIDHLWSALVVYQMVQGIVCTAIGFAWLIASYFLLRKIRNSWPQPKTEIKYGGEVYVLTFWHYVYGLVLGVLLLGCIYWVISIPIFMIQIWAPDAAALKDIVSMIRGH